VCTHLILLIALRAELDAITTIKIDQKSLGRQDENEK
jgi:hypothetical protein